MTASSTLFDPYSAAFLNDPTDTYRRLREQAPVYHNAEHDFYALSRHEDVAAAFRDHETYSSAYGLDLAMVKSGQPPPIRAILMMDPPEHREMRSLVNKVFTPRAIAGLAPMVDETIERFLPSRDVDTFDLVIDFAALFPVEVISQMLGVPPEHRQDIRRWVDEAMEREPGQTDISEAGMTALANSFALYYQLIEQRRAAPQDDMISDLIAAEVAGEDDGRPAQLDDVEIAGFLTLLGGAGAETVTKLVGQAGVLFGRHPEQWDALLHDRSKIPAAVEELLRYEAPSQYFVRRSMRDVDLHGVTIPAGKPVFLLLGSANRDPEAFPDPDAFDIDRDRTRAVNLGFGYGVHSCLGAALARMESAVALDKLLDLMPRFEVDPRDCRRVSSMNVAGWSHVPVRILR